MQFSPRPVVQLRRWACACVAIAMAWAGAPAGAQLSAAWVNPVDGLWTDGSKWTTAPNFPANSGTGTVIVSINVAGAPYTVQGNANVNIGKLLMSSPDATLLLPVGGSLSTTHAGSISNGAQVRVTGGNFYPRSDLSFHPLSWFSVHSGARVSLESGSFGFGSHEFELHSGGRVEQSGGGQNWGPVRIYRGSWTMNAGTAMLSSGNSLVSLVVGTGSGNAGTFHQTGGTVMSGSQGLSLDVGTEGATGMAMIEGPSTVFGDFPSTNKLGVIGRGTGGAGHAFFRDGATVRLGDTIVGLAGGAGSLTIDGGASATLHTLSVGSGTGAGGVGTVLLTGGARLAVGNLFSTSTPIGIVNVGTSTGIGTGYLRVDSGTFTTHAPVGSGAIAVRQGGTFDLNGGFVRTGSLFVNSGLLRLTSGTLSSTSAQLNDGQLIQSSGVGSFAIVTLTNAAAGSLELSGGALTIGQLNHTAGQSRFSGGSLSLGSGVMTGGTMTVAGAMVRGTGSMFVRAPAHVRFESGELSVGPLTLDGGQVLVSPGGEKVFRTTDLSFTPTPGGRVDLGDNAMTIDHAGASPAESVRAYIASAHDGGAWTGDGLSSSAAAATPDHALGYAEASALATIPPVFGTVDDTTLLVRYTRYGDADLDHVVNLNDFNRLAANFGTGARWDQGDFNYDGNVSLDDFNLLAANFGLIAADAHITPHDWSALAAAVPEPSLCTPVLLLPLGAWRRRGRRAVNGSSTREQAVVRACAIQKLIQRDPSATREKIPNHF